MVVYSLITKNSTDIIIVGMENRVKARNAIVDAVNIVFSLCGWVVASLVSSLCILALPEIFYPRFVVGVSSVFPLIIVLEDGKEI